MHSNDTCMCKQAHPHLMKRVEDVNITRTIVIGTRAVAIRPPSVNTHSWQLYIKALNDRPMPYISRIVITLHETFRDPVRTLTEPFVLEEKGWGEFTIGGRVYFNDLNEKFISFTHFLKLYGENDEVEVVNERIETIVFRSPSRRLYDMLGDEEEMDDGSDGERIDRAIEHMLGKHEQF